MRKKKLTKTTKKSYSPLEKRKIIEEILSGFYCFAQARKKYISSKTKFSRWNRWYFKIRLLPHFKPNPFPTMKKAKQSVEELKKQLNRSFMICRSSSTNRYAATQEHGS
jgi:transposase-like protein